MRRLAVVLAFCAGLEPVSAVALSCARWSPAQAYERADAAADSYSVVVGTFDFDSAALPKAEAVVPAMLTGRALAPTGFDAAWSKPIRIEVGCAASWCGSVVPGLPYLVFVRHEGSSLSVDLGPCPTVVFLNPTKVVEREITLCLTSGRCDTN